ncbi:MAG: DUF6178 family protein [bacterium]
MAADPAAAVSPADGADQAVAAQVAAPVEVAPEEEADLDAEGAEDAEEAEGADDAEAGRPPTTPARPPARPRPWCRPPACGGSRPTPSPWSSGLGPPGRERAAATAVSHRDRLRPGPGSGPALPDRAHALRPAPRSASRPGARRWSARSGSELLDAFISPADAPHLVPMLPVEDLHRAIHRIGLEDAVDILAMASGEQVQGLLDTEIWEGDELSSDRADPWLQALMAAGPDVLGRRLIDLDDELLNWLMRRSVQVIVVEEPDDFDPPDVEHVLTPDGRICICFPDPGERDLPVKIFMDWLMRTAPVYCIDLLIGSSAALDSSLQEDALRWRSGRLADRGYVDFYDALAIYAPPPAAPATPAATDDGPAPRHWLASLVDPEARLAAALERVAPDAAERLIAQLGYAANMALSADRREPWDLDGQAETLQRLRAGIVLGLDALGGAGADPAADAELLLRLGPSVVFRNGYARMLAAAEPLRQRSLRPRLRRGDDPVGAFDVPTWQHAWAAGALRPPPGLRRRQPPSGPASGSRRPPGHGCSPAWRGSPATSALPRWGWAPGSRRASPAPCSASTASAPCPSTASPRLAALFAEGRLRPRPRPGRRRGGPTSASQERRWRACWWPSPRRRPAWTPPAGPPPVPLLLPEL